LYYTCRSYSSLSLVFTRDYNSVSKIFYVVCKQASPRNAVHCHCSAYWRINSSLLPVFAVFSFSTKLNPAPNWLFILDPARSCVMTARTTYKKCSLLPSKVRPPPAEVCEILARGGAPGVEFSSFAQIEIRICPSGRFATFHKSIRRSLLCSRGLCRGSRHMTL